MSRKLSFLLLSAFLLAQCCPAHSTHSSESDESDIPEKIKLIKFAMDELTPFANHSVAFGKTLFKNTLHELTAEKEKSPTTEEHITKLSHFVEEVDKYEADNDGPIELFKLLEKLGQLLMEVEEEPPKSENLVYISALKNHGLDKFESETEKEFWEFSKKFEEQIDHYLSGLSEKEKKDESKMFDWLSEYKTEKDTEKKLELLPKFMSLYDNVTI